jgi:cytochrome c-type biogenesis protein CcmH/NrfF
MISSNMLYFLFAGILIICLLFLRPPWTITNLVIGITPLVFMLFIVVMILREKRRQKNKPESGESR